MKSNGIVICDGPETLGAAITEMLRDVASKNAPRTYAVQIQVRQLYDSEESYELTSAVFNKEEVAIYKSVIGTFKRDR